MRETPSVFDVLREGSTIAERIYGDRRRAYKARKQFDRIIGAYKELLENPAYKLISEEAKQGLGEQLKILVDEASRCSRCCQHAARVKMLQEVVLEPIERVWQEQQRVRLEVEAQADES